MDLKEPQLFDLRRIPFAAELGFVLEACAGGRSRIRFVPRAEHGNSFGVIHGGAVMTLLDVSMAVAASALRPDAGCVTVEMKTSFMQGVPLQPGRAVHGVGQLLHATRSMAFMQAQLEDADGVVRIHATGTFKYLRRRGGAPGG